MIETILTEINEAGWTLGYLRQAGVGWEAQLTRPCSDLDYSFELAYWSGPTPEEALEGALGRAEIVGQPKAKYKVAPGVDILADLGLTKPIHRRF